MHGHICVYNARAAYVSIETYRFECVLNQYEIRKTKRAETVRSVPLVRYFGESFVSEKRPAS